jgi:pSer/pThr/pTyr-binding forkhead associated (FHA) protein
MVEQVLLLLQALFLVLLYLFIWRVVRTASRDLRLPQESFFLAPSQLGARPAGGDGAPRRRLVTLQSHSVEPGSSFELGTAPITIGRAAENTIALGRDEYASARHARIEPLRDGIWVVDLGSTNGTAVNGRRIDGRERLKEGDVVRIGETEWRLER